jgi:alpha-glucuronidase
MRVIAKLLGALALLMAGAAQAEDGYDLWLRYGRAAGAAPVPAVAVEAAETSPQVAAAAGELVRALTGITGAAPRRATAAEAGAVLLGTPASPAVARLRLPLNGLGEEGYLVRRVAVDGRPVTVVAGNTGRGVLYGSFALIARMQRGEAVTELRSAPKVALRVLNHWDNLDRSVERGYAGQSIWDWWTLPAYKDPRYTDYARANASVGINGAVLNNVNAKSDSLTAPYLAKAAAVADVLRPWGIKVYLSARFTAPMELGGLKTADPLDPQVRAWWKAKADEVWATIPDFGGFLVKANSEGQPGPRDYRRTHADGANMLADAVRPHGGIVMWRAFVYAETDPTDRAKQAYAEFKPLDGRFADNVLVQVKNGPLDFQPREPFHPLFGAMPKTPLMMEVQLTKEYLGFNTNLAYLGTMWEEVLRARTGRGGTVADVVDGTAERHRLTGIAGVANIGNSRTWTGSVFDQANWYAFGRMAWNPDVGAREVAADWATLTFGAQAAAPVTDMMTGSRELVVDYTGALGLAHLMGTGHHHGPGPWISDLARPEWNPAYYHRADAAGIGFDRLKSGSDAVGQYAPAAQRELLADERYLLWFRHVPWDHRMADGRTLWETLVARYDRGVAGVAAMQDRWKALAGAVDAERHAEVASFLAIQQGDARLWRDASIAYWQSVNRLPLPAGAAAPAHDLSWYKAQSFPYAPGQAR